MTETTLQTLHPAGWKAAKGYANGIAAQGRMVFLGGQIGWNANQVFESDDFIEQTLQTLRNIVEVLQEAGGRPEHIVRMTWFVTDKAEYLARLRELGQAYREIIGRHFPAMSVVQVVALMEDAAKVEIEATAVLPE
ncbi:MAG: RidA family protein [Mesorhizobium sp.]|jgi:enamine deaminase RidA (YjgF/YER057c/UK114 family)